MLFLTEIKISFSNFPCTVLQGSYRFSSTPPSGPFQVPSGSFKVLLHVLFRSPSNPLQIPCRSPLDPLQVSSGSPSPSPLQVFYVPFPKSPPGPADPLLQVLQVPFSRFPPSPLQVPGEGTAAPPGQRLAKETNLNIFFPDLMTHLGDKYSVILTLLLAECLMNIYIYVSTGRRISI